MRQARNINNLGRASSRYLEMCDACTPAGYINLGDGKHYYFAKDYQGSTRAVYTHYEGSLIGPGNPFTVSSTLAVNPEDLQIVKHDVKQRMCYYPSGLPINIYEGDAVTDRLHLGKP